MTTVEPSSGSGHETQEQDVAAAVPGPGAAATLLERLVDRLGGRTTVSTVFGEPVVHGDVAVVPVARVGFGFGAGTGQGRNSEHTGEGGGGGGGGGVKPIGFVEIRDGGAEFKPIRQPWVDRLAPLAAVVALYTIRRVTRAVARRARPRGERW